MLALSPKKARPERPSRLVPGADHEVGNALVTNTIGNAPAALGRPAIEALPAVTRIQQRRHISRSIVNRTIAHGHNARAWSHRAIQVIRGVNRSRGEIIFSFKPAFFHRFQVAMPRKLAFRCDNFVAGSTLGVRTAATPALAPLVSAISSDCAPIVSRIMPGTAVGHFKKCRVRFLVRKLFDSSAAALRESKLSDRLLPRQIKTWRLQFRPLLAPVELRRKCVVDTGNSFPRNYKT